MPTFAELQKRLNRTDRATMRLGNEELLVTDARARMRPGDFVEQKLRAAQRVTSRHPAARPSPRRLQS